LALSRRRDNAKKVNGRKRHIAVDTTGLLLVVLVTGAGVQDRHGARLLLWTLMVCFARVSMVWVDGGYSGAPVDYGTALGLIVEVVAKLAGQIGSPSCLAGGWWKGPSPGSTGADVPPATTNAYPNTTPP
jgi:Transposase DDE domain